MRERIERAQTRSADRQRKFDVFVRNRAIDVAGQCEARTRRFGMELKRDRQDRVDQIGSLGRLHADGDGNLVERPEQIQVYGGPRVGLELAPLERNWHFRTGVGVLQRQMPSLEVNRQLRLRQHLSQSV